MHARTLGTDLQVSAVGLGCMGMTHAYGAPADRRAMVDLLAEAVDTGYTFFDTAEVYVSDDGAEHNEDLVGEGLAPYRDRVVLATKCGIEFGPAGYVYLDRPEQIRASLEGSLRRLRTDHVDLFYLHRHGPETPIEAVAAVMADLVAEGKITHWGLSEVPEDTIRRAHAVCPVTAVQNRMSMMYREDVALLPVLEELGVGYVAFSPLANGLLSDRYDPASTFGAQDFRSRMPQFAAAAYEANKELLSLVRGLAERHGATPAGISLAWVLAQGPAVTAIPGTRRSERLRENARAADVELSAADVRAVDEALEKMTMSEVFGQGSRR
jgi:aryl-alcohol dehydrogenase-like predicted oxidoreductase